MYWTTLLEYEVDLQFLIGCFLVTPEGEGQATEQAPMVFRVCMANVLISAAQKISSSSRPMFAKMIMPPLLNYLEVLSNFQRSFEVFQTHLFQGKQLEKLVWCPSQLDQHQEFW
jgi:hypothetical protein